MPETKFNWPVIGHKKIVNYLQNSIKTNNLAPAYLITGGEHLGKRFLVDNFILSLICEGTEKPCRKCSACEQYLKGVHPDIIVTTKVEEKSAISVEQIRELKKKLSLHALAIEHKISLIDPADVMNKEGQNALLKILEEPLGPTIHILISHQTDNVLPTIVSRCQSLQFLPVSSKDIFAYINRKASEQKARVITGLALGRPGVARTLLENQGEIKEYQADSKRLLDFFNQNIHQRIKTTSEFISSEQSYSLLGQKIVRLLDNWQLIIRDLALVKNDNVNLVSNLGLVDQIKEVAEEVEVNKIVKIGKLIQESKVNIMRNVNPKLVLENLVINI